MATGGKPLPQTASSFRFDMETSEHDDGLSALKAPIVRKTLKSSKLKVAHLVHVTHRDQVEAPLTDWLKEAFDVSERLSGRREKGMQHKRHGKGHKKHKN